MTKKQVKVETIKTDLLCPCCKQPLYRQYGNQINPGDPDHGMMLFCIHGDPDARRHPQEVAGHGFGRSDEAMMKAAYAIIQAKFCGAKLVDEGILTEVEDDEPASKPAPVVEEPKKAKRAKRQQPPVVEDDDSI